MPIVDMPLEKLKEYKGISPKPSDFDEYWDRNIKLADAVDTNVELVPAKEKFTFADAFHLYFTGTGGARVHAKLLVPKNISGKAPAVLHFHGYGGSSEDFAHYSSFVASGMVVAALDCRGQGGPSFDLGEGISGDMLIGEIVMGVQGDPENLLYKHIFLDTYLLSKIVKSFDYVDETRVAAFGGSQGGALTCVCASLDPDIKVAVPAYPFLSDYKRVWSMDLARSAYIGIHEYFRKFDPLHEKEDEFFEKLGYIDIKNLAPRVKAKLLMFTGLIDTICPASTQFAFFNNATGCAEKDVKIYPDFGHERLPMYEDISYDYIIKNI